MKKSMLLLFGFTLFNFSLVMAAPSNNCEVNLQREVSLQEIQDLYVRCAPPITVEDIKSMKTTQYTLKTNC